MIAEQSTSDGTKLRKIRFSRLPGTHEGLKNLPQEIEVELTYVGDGNASDAIVLDNQVIPEIVDAVTGRPRRFEEWNEDEYGPALWWEFPIEEPPYCGTPLDCDWPWSRTDANAYENIRWTLVRLPRCDIQGDLRTEDR